MGCSWERVTLGRTGLRVTPIGLAASYGVGERDLLAAWERGVNYFYWGSRRRGGFGRGMKRIARKDRANMVTVVQSYARIGSLMRPSLELALRELGIEYTDVLLLGWWNEPPPDRIIDAALTLCEQGKARTVMISCHNRPTFAKFVDDDRYGAIMVRYNAAHPGAEKEVFPFVRAAGARRPGVVSYTATRWGQLVSPRLVPPGERTPRGSDCYRFVLSQPDVDLVLAGPKDVDEMNEALAALDRGPMSEDELAWMKRVGAAVKSGAAEPSRLSPIALLDRLKTAVARRSNDG